jgi:hypothetical protein
VIVTFLALLEMTKLRMTRIYQADPTASIHVHYALLDADSPTVPPEAPVPAIIETVAADEAIASDDAAHTVAESIQPATLDQDDDLAALAAHSEAPVEEDSGDGIGAEFEIPSAAHAVADPDVHEDAPEHDESNP